MTDWMYRQPRKANACVMQRRCLRCPLEETQQEHSFKWMYSDELPQEPGFLSAIGSALTSTCHQIAACEDCGERGKGGSRVEHLWGSLVHNPNDGHYYRECARCDVVDKIRM
jgi:hypothetical protein